VIAFRENQRRESVSTMGTVMESEVDAVVNHLRCVVPAIRIDAHFTPRDLGWSTLAPVSYVMSVGWIGQTLSAVWIVSGGVVPLTTMLCF
jgi:hypothetical protein